jgi:multiple sugar transport system substrate-binding protein
VTDPCPARPKQIELFRKSHPNIEVYVDQASGGAIAKVLIQLAAHAGPDLIDIYSPPHLQYYAQHGALLPISEMCKESGITNGMFWPQCRGWMEWKEEIYGIPTNAGTFVLFYNKDHFDRAGLAYPTADWTWENFLTAAKKLTLKSSDGRRIEQFGCYPYVFEHFIWQAGGDYWNSDLSRCTLDTPQALKAIRFLNDLRVTWRVAPTRADEQNFSWGGWGEGAINLFATGRVSMVDMGRWAIVTFRRYQKEGAAAGDKPLRYGVAELPHDVTRANWFVSRATTINSECRHPKEAFEFLKFLTSPEYNRLICEGGDGFPSIRAIAESDMFLQDPNYPEEDQNRVHLDAVRWGRVEQISPHIKPAEYTKLRDDHYELLRAGEIQPERFCRDLTMKVNRAIEKALAPRLALQEATQGDIEP